MIKVICETNDSFCIEPNDPISLSDIITKAEQKWGITSFGDIKIDIDDQIYCDESWENCIRVRKLI